MVASLTFVPVLMCSLMLVYLERITHGENCPINPECTCSKTEGSFVRCTRKYTPYFPKFAASTSKFGTITVKGSREIREIRNGSFQGVSATGLKITNTGIKDVRCYEWMGLSGLTTLDLRKNELTSIPGCSWKLLRTLRLSENNLSVIESGAFRNFSKLDFLDLQYNQISEISVGAFEGLYSLFSLNISWNNLTVIENKVFVGLTSLKTLDLRNNRITTLHARGFDGLLNLETLYIGTNDISSMDGNTFLTLTNLATLSMENNKISEIPSVLLKSMKRLIKLHIQDNFLSELTENIFEENQDLEYLDLRNNRLTDIHPDTFLTTSKLKNLLLYGNSITHIKPALFVGLPYIYNLDLGYNKLTELETRLFVNCQNLTNIYLQGNFIHRLDGDPFENATSLSTVDLGNNQLKKLPVTLLASAKLRDLKLGGNRITFLASTIIHRHKSTFDYLNLAANGLTSASWPWLEEIITGLLSFAQVDLAYNEFTNVPSDIVGIGGNVLVFRNKLKQVEINLQSSRFPFISLDHNDIESVVVNLNSHLPILSFFLANNKLSGPVILRTMHPVNTTIHFFDLSFNGITEIDQFPLQVVPSKALLGCPTFIVYKLNLSHNAISVVPAEACLGSAGELDLSDNRIEVLGPLVPEYNSSLYRLRNIYLSGNRIHRISSDAFANLGSVYILRFDLSYNNLTQVDSLRALSIRGAFRSNSRLLLFGNPIHCDCKTDWLSSEPSAPNVDAVRCHTPQTANGFLVVCYDALGCVRHFKKTDPVLDMCKKDTYVRISNVTAHVFLSDPWPRVNVTWIRTGPGMITAFKMTTYSGPEQTEPARLVSAEERNAVILYSTDGLYVRMCISAVLESGAVTEQICTNVSQEIKSSGVTQLPQMGEELHVSTGLFFGLVTCLVMFLVILTLGITVYVIRRRRSDSSQPSGSVSPSEEGESDDVIRGSVDYENVDNGKNRYETLRKF